jgi:uncharacterized membrane protein
MEMPKNFFSEEEQTKLIAQIIEAESMTSGEIRVHLESDTKGMSSLKRAEYVFHKLAMENTAARNAILIYIATDSRKLALWADHGIHKVVPVGYWESTIDHMLSYFKAGQFFEGTHRGISMIGQKLKTYFPYQRNDINEITDEISFGNV